MILSFTILNKTVLVNDIAWNFFIADVTSLNYPAIIVKVNPDGNIAEAFPVISSPNKNYTITTDLSGLKLDVLPDSSFIVSMATTYYPGQFGISENSYRDISLFKFGIDRSFEWVTSIDYGVEELFWTYPKDGIIYVSIATSKSTSAYWLWVHKVNISDGSVINSNWVNSTYTGSNDYRLFWIVLVTNQYTYINYNYNLLIYETSTLEPKILSLLGNPSIVGIQLSPSQSPNFYYINNKGGINVSNDDFLFSITELFPDYRIRRCPVPPLPNPPCEFWRILAFEKFF